MSRTWTKYHWRKHSRGNALVSPIYQPNNQRKNSPSSPWMLPNFWSKIWDTNRLQQSLACCGKRTALSKPPSCHPGAANPAFYYCSNKVEVAAVHAKNGRVQCTVNTNFVSCNCPSSKFDSICKHSIAVAQLKGFLEKHLNHVTKKAGPRRTKAALAEANVDKQRAGNKGGRSKAKSRPSKEQITPTEAQTQRNQGLYTHIHQNDNPFVVRLLPEEAKKCKTCNVDFCHRQRHVPFDLVLEHKERWYFPKEGGWNNKVPTNRGKTILPSKPTEMFEAQVPLHNFPVHQGSRGNHR